MAYTSARHRPDTSSPGDDSRTITVTNAQPEQDAGGPSNAPDAVGALHLTGGEPPRRTSRPHVSWGEDVVDNEGCGRKSSKICCIYDKPRRFDESSDEDSSDSDEDSDSDIDDGRARRSNQHRPQHSHNHPHRHAHDGNGDAGGVLQDPQSSSVTQLEQPSEPNAYERAPKGKKGKGKQRSE